MLNRLSYLVIAIGLLAAPQAQAGTLVNPYAFATQTVLEDYEEEGTNIPINGPAGYTWFYDVDDVGTSARSTDHETEGTYSWRITHTSGLLTGVLNDPITPTYADLSAYNTLLLDYNLVAITGTCSFVLEVTQNSPSASAETSTSSTGTGTLQLDLTSLGNAADRDEVLISHSIFCAGAGTGDVYFDNLRGQ